MDFSFELPGERSSGSSSAVGSDKLRKAIERNRAKQAQRERITQKKESEYSAKNDQMSMGDIWARRKAKAGKARTSSAAVRTRVAKPDDTEFVSTVRKTKKVVGKVNYIEPRKRMPIRRVASIRRPQKKSSGIMSKFPYLFWGFCLFLLLRLIMVDRGVLDYYSHLRAYERKEIDLQTVRQDNEILRNEIKRIKNNPSYQKKLVRDHLGYISKDEFLVLFPKGS